MTTQSLVYPVGESDDVPLRNELCGHFVFDDSRGPRLFFKVCTINDVTVESFKHAFSLIFKHYPSNKFPMQPDSLKSLISDSNHPPLLLVLGPDDFYQKPQKHSDQFFQPSYIRAAIALAKTSKSTPISLSGSPLALEVMNSDRDDTLSLSIDMNCQKLNFELAKEGILLIRDKFKLPLCTLNDACRQSNVMLAF